jgi:hypothetical protein
MLVPRAIRRTREPVSEADEAPGEQADDDGEQERREFEHQHGGHEDDRERDDGRDDHDGQDRRDEPQRVLDPALFWAFLDEVHSPIPRSIL